MKFTYPRSPLELYSAREKIAMMTGYQITEKLYEDIKTIVYRGQRKVDQKAVVLKVLRADYPTQKEIARIRHEYELTKDLAIEGIVRSYGLEKHNGLSLVLEDFSGVHLKSFLATHQLESVDFLDIAIQLTETLGKLHAKNIIHKDIKPINIIINAHTKQVKLTDFSIASSLSRENQIISNPNLLEGTLAYMSPEQTGRMNRTIDYRTDFYSLGVTFYELLTGQLPFSTTDPMELVYCHIAKQPIPPHIVQPTVSLAVSEIVMKLLAKTPEDRYQSAYGIKADLEECLNQLQTIGTIKPFVPGQKDVSAKFQIPQKLYGREQEIATLIAAFDRVSQGKTELVLVSGYSGIGKTALIHEIHKSLVQCQGYFIAGKCDQYKRNVPYASLVQAFQDLVRQLLTETAEKLEVWRGKLIHALGNSGQVILDVIPEMELIIGEQPAVPLLGPTETQNRFNLVFQKFIEVFTQKGHPLVIFLDDLQWADSASLKLIQLLSGEGGQSLLLIGSYRDNEVSPTHPLVETLEDIRASVQISDIAIRPLDLACTNQLVAETLHSDAVRTFPLAELVFNKTAGNPFFLTQLFTSLYQDNLLTFDSISGCWQWDIEQIKATEITDNVAELMVSKIQKLAQTTQDVLKLAACVGSVFDLDVLAIVNEKSLSATAAELWEALQEDLILPLSDGYKLSFVEQLEASTALSSEHKVSYKFLHDRIQQSIYALIPDDAKEATHLKVGRLLLHSMTPTEIEEHIFDVVNHLNLGAALIEEQAEKDKLAHLNLSAGHKAKVSTAYETAAKHLTVALDLLAPDSWQHQYALTLALYTEAVEVEYLNANFESAKQLAEVVLHHAKALLEKVKVYEIQIQFHISQNQMQAALDVALPVLDMLDEPLIQTAPSQLNVEDLSHLPIMTDPTKLAAMQILMTAMPPAYVANPALLPAIAYSMVSLCVKYGNSPLAAYAYGFYGLLLCGSSEDIDAGYQFGQLAVRLLEQFDARELKCKVYELFNAHIRPFKEHARETIEPLQKAVQYGLETGDVEYAGYSAMYACIYPFFMGEPLDGVQQKQRQYIDLMVKLKQDYLSSYITIWHQLALNLSRETADPHRLSGESFDEAVMLPHFTETNNGALLFSTYLAKSMLLYWLKDYDQALEMSQLSEKYSGYLLALMHTPEHTFYYSLILLAQPDASKPEHQARILSQVESNQNKLKQWALHAPMNYQHKYDLVNAETARCLGHTLEAMEYYDRAIQGAREQGFVQEEALANERAAEFYLTCNREKVARTYFTEAYRGYAVWGATTKLKAMEASYSHLIYRIAPETLAGKLTASTTASTSESVNILDLTTIVKASQALAGEIVLSKLLDKLLRIVMENAAAQISYLILDKGGQLLIEAMGDLNRNEVLLLPSLPVASSQQLPVSVLNYVARTQESIVLGNAAKEGKFTTDLYIVRTQPKSVLCAPILNQGRLIGLLYLENTLTSDAFTPDRLEILNLLSSQAAISLENALLYASLEATTEDLKRAKYQLEDYNRTLEQKVAERTQELHEKNRRLKEQSTELEQTLHQLKQTQTQLIQTEKMSSLGNLVAGVAHEINNPVNFIHGNLSHAGEYSRNLLKLIQLYQQECPNPSSKLQAEIEASELEFVIEDLPKMLSSMQMGADRIREIVLSLRNFSRLDEADVKRVDIHQGIDSTLLILQSRLKKASSPEIQIIKEYGTLPPVECYAGQLNQVFMNVINNAIDVLQENDDDRSGSKVQQKLSTITIRTAVVEHDRVRISIADNGPGIPEEVHSRLFDPFFTTKPVGSGTGLGLSISYQIVVEKHGGHLTCLSAPGQGAEFVIEIPIERSTAKK